MRVSAWDLIRDGKWELDSGSAGGSSPYDSEYIDRIIRLQPPPASLLRDLGVRHVGCFNCSDYRAARELEEARGRHVVAMLVVFTVGAVLGILAGIVIGKVAL